MCFPTMVYSRAYYIKGVSYAAKRVERRIISKACAQQLTLYAVLNSLNLNLGLFYTLHLSPVECNSNGR